MTQKEFIKVLDKKGYSYEIEGDKIIVTHVVAHLSIPALDTTPNQASTLTKSIVTGLLSTVDLKSLTSLPSGVVFKNGGNVYLMSLTSIPPGVEFRNKGDVKLDSLTRDWFSKWKGNIKGIDSKRLLNSMINKGVFER